jgi:ABC-type phosphate/phosphonate transport system substrate-binding protein
MVGSRPRTRLVLAVLALIGLSIPGRGEEPSAPIVSRLGITRNQTPGLASRDVAVSIDYWFGQMSGRSGSPHVPSTKIFDDLGQLRAALERGELEVVVVLARDYLALRDDFSLEPVIVTVGDEGELIRFSLYTPRQREIRHLEDLRGGRIIFDETEGAMLGRLWLETLLLRAGIDPSGFAAFEDVERTSQAVLPVYFGQADACVTAVSTYRATAGLNPDIDRELESVATSDSVAVGIICYTDQMDPAYRPIITGALLGMHEDPEGRKILQLFRRDRAIPFASEHIRLIKELEQDHARLKSGR